MKRHQRSKLVWSRLDILLLIAFALMLGAIAFDAGAVAVGILLMLYTALFYVRVYQVAGRQSRPWVLWVALAFATFAGQVIQPGQHMTGLHAVLWLAIAVGALLIMALSAVHERNARLRR